ncbi:MAG TPA: DUF177 domain-containing protein [Myxococcota bacterium]|nr:DUF177 domain-containing protein [Myxococcota bacterium]
MGDFNLSIERLTEIPEEIVFEASPEWWAARDPAVAAGLCEVEEAFRFVVSASRVREDVILIGNLAGRVGLECSRCARRYSHALADDFRLVLEPAGDREPADPEGAEGLAANGLCLAEDLEAGWTRGPRIRLDDFFGEVVALAMPIQPLCSEDCLGLCPHCGADRASTPCECVDQKPDSPFAVLARLKNDQASE